MANRRAARPLQLRCPRVNSEEKGTHAGDGIPGSVVLLILQEEVEARARELAERCPEFRAIAEATSQAAGLRDLAMKAEEVEG